MGRQLDRNVGSHLIGKVHLGSFRCQSAAMHITLLYCVEESIHVHRCRSYQQSEKQMKQTTGKCRVRSTSYDNMRALRRILAGQQDAISPIRPTI